MIELKFATWLEQFNSEHTKYTKKDIQYMADDVFVLSIKNDLGGMIRIQVPTQFHWILKDLLAP